MGDTRMNIYNSSTGKQASKQASCWEELLGTATGNCLLCARAQHSKLSQSWGTGGWDVASWGGVCLLACLLAFVLRSLLFCPSKWTLFC
jgi:hypothetical protein